MGAYPSVYYIAVSMRTCASKQYKQHNQHNIHTDKGVI
jgi:hypothetical protein